LWGQNSSLKPSAATAKTDGSFKDQNSSLKTITAIAKTDGSFGLWIPPLKLPDLFDRIYYEILVESRILINTYSGLPEVYTHLVGGLGDYNKDPLWGLEGGKNGVPA
jgi:hypothetical protein